MVGARESGHPGNFPGKSKKTGFSLKFSRGKRLRAQKQQKGREEREFVGFCSLAV